KYGKEGTDINIDITVQENIASDDEVFRHADKIVEVAVEDNGDGISEEDIPRLTERFYRVDKMRSRKVGGTGLGLAIVKHILNRHRGDLAIKSETGKGSVFTVRLPVWEQGKING